MAQEQATEVMQEIQLHLDELTTAIQERGYLNCSVELLWSSYTGKKLRVEGYADEGYLGRVYEYFYPTEETYPAFVDAVADAMLWIEGRESVKDKRKEILLRKISDTIAYAQAQGEEVAPDVDFIQPLKNLMKKLSENIITHKKESGE